MTDARRQFGTAGEHVAASYLERKGMRVIARAFRTRFGEIDLVCEDGEELVFVEVKTRRSVQYGLPEEAITREKYATMVRCAEAYLQTKTAEQRPWRLDVVAVRVNVEPSQPCEITHFAAVDSPYSA